MLLLRNPRHRVFGWALAGFGLFWASTGWPVLRPAGLMTDDAWPGMTFAVWFLNRFGAFLAVPIVVLLLIFPDGRFLPGRWGAAGRAA